MKVLLVEDNPADAVLTRELLAESKLNIALSVVTDGEEAMKRLQNPSHRPDLVLLDLNLPRLDGREVLRRVKSDPTLKSIPVIVLTTSRDGNDVEESYRSYANCFVSKPVDLEEYRSALQCIEQFWFQTARIPL